MVGVQAHYNVFMCVVALVIHGYQYFAKLRFCVVMAHSPLNVWYVNCTIRTWRSYDEKVDDKVLSLNNWDHPDTNDDMAKYINNDKPQLL